MAHSSFSSTSWQYRLPSGPSLFFKSNRGTFRAPETVLVIPPFQQRSPSSASTTRPHLGQQSWSSFSALITQVSMVDLASIIRCHRTFQWLELLALSNKGFRLWTWTLIQVIKIAGLAVGLRHQVPHDASNKESSFLLHSRRGKQF